MSGSPPEEGDNWGNPADIVGESGSDWSAPPKTISADQETKPGNVAQGSQYEVTDNRVSDANNDWSDEAIHAEASSGNRSVSNAVVEVRNVGGLPTAPKSGIWASSKYALSVLANRRRLKKAISQLESQNHTDTRELDQALRKLAEQALAHNISTPATKVEERGIRALEQDIAQTQDKQRSVSEQLAEENRNYGAEAQHWEQKIGDLKAKLESAEAQVDEIRGKQRQLSSQMSELDRRSDAYDKTAEARRKELTAAPADQRRALEQTIEELGQQRASLAQQRNDLQSRHDSFEEPLHQAEMVLESASSKFYDAKEEYELVTEQHKERVNVFQSELTSIQTTLNDLQVQHGKRLNNLGTLLNLERPAHDELNEQYREIDGLKGVITARAREIERLDTRRGDYDQKAVMRGALTISVTVLVVVIGIGLLVYLL